MKRLHTTFTCILILLLSGQVSSVLAQTKFWTGGNGQWDDPAHWSATAQGSGGAGVPRVNEDVVIEASTPLHITLRGTAWCKALSVNATQAQVRVSGTTKAEINIAGAWRFAGNVLWDASSPVHLMVRREGVEVDLRGRPIGGDVVLDGSGSWSLISDLICSGDIRLKQGTLIANGTRMDARSLIVEGNARKQFLAGNSAVVVAQEPDMGALRSVVQPGASTLVVNGTLRPWNINAAEGAVEDRDINICGTGAGQTPFTVNAQLITNYNGYGVRCRGNCNATVSVTVTGGSGNFTYSWLGGGPATATWTTACGGPQLVIVTDVGQGISCPAQVNVTEPAPLGVIFFGQGTPPTCADACNGTRSALAIGGVSPHTYSWNNGAGTGSSFTQLCSGVNTLRITDFNGCTRDTTFIFNLAPIAPNLTLVNSSCFGDCSGSATVAPTGGTGAYTILWTPPPAVQGGLTANGLCAGNYTVNIRDANNCDTTVTFVITQPPPILVTSTVTPATCFGTCNGSATVVPSGAVGPYTFLWAPPPGAGQSTATATGLCQGPYTVRITDQASGCDTLITVTITGPPAINVQGTVTDATCSNSCDGTIVLSVSGGSPGYTFLWSPVPSAGQGTGSVSGLCAGDWTVTVTDVAGCDTTVTFTVEAPPPVIPIITITDATCAGLCDGTASVAVTGGVPPYTYLWSPGPVTGQGTPAVTALCAGAYSVTVSDLNGCDTTITFSIIEPPPLLVTPAHTNVTCGNLCDGTASVVVTGGTPGYTYLWTPAPPVGQGTANASGLCAGPISVLITDASGCTITSAFVILDAVPLLFSLQLTPASCPDVCDGAAGVIVTGGISPYAYNWVPAPGAGQGTANVTGLCAQAYNLTVTDAVGCDSTISFTITAPLAIVPNPSQTDVTCANQCNGTIILAPTGGNGTYTYNWVPPPPIGQGTASATGLCAGDWSVTIASGGCDTTITITILEPPPILASVVPTNASCSNACDGSAVVTASGGTPLLNYLWTPAPTTGQGTPNADGFCPGAYSVTVSDAAGCDTTLNFTILAPPPILPGLATTPETCSGPCTGTATVAPLGGTGTIIANWQPAPGGGQGTFQATGLCSGINYTVALTDVNGCDTTVAFTIQPSATIVPNSSSTPASCDGLCDGTATVGPTGGTPPYTYVWSPPPPIGQGTPSAGGLCAGPVQVRITDAALCTIVADILITEPPPILSNGTVTNPLCAGICDGVIVLNTVGGVGPYSYNWTPAPPNGQGTNTITGLCAGTWNVTITDASGCTASSSHTVTAPPTLTLDVVTTTSQCQVCIGTATAAVGGGTGLLSIEWRNASNVVIGTTETVTDLCAGVYTATVTDENGCTLQQTVPITDSDGETLTTTDGITTCPTSCDGEVSVSFTCSDPPCSIAWTDAAGVDLGQSGNTLTALCAGDYYVSVTNGSGCVSIDTATVAVPVTVVLNISSTPVSCTAACDGTATIGIVGGTPPYTFTWDPAPPTGQGTPTIANLCAGVYDVTVGDGVGCTTIAQVLITEPPPLSLFSSIVIGTSCAGSCEGNITLLVAGGTQPLTYLWTPAPPAGQGSSAAFGFCAGPVDVLITDVNGCSLSRSFVVDSPQPLQVSATSTPSTCPNCDGTGTLTVLGGTMPYSFSWMLGGVEVSTDQSPTGLCGGVYTVNVRDAFGCTFQTIVDVFDSNAEVLDPINGVKVCANTCDGEVSVNLTCSAPPCVTQWTDASGNILATNSTVLSGLCAGVYTAQVTNANGCVSLADATILPQQQVIPNLSTTPASCSGVCDATATVGPSGGIGPYTYTWSPEPGDGQGTPQATELCAGVYTVVIADATGCDTTVSVLILEPAPLVQQAVVTDASCSGSCNGSIVVTPAGGTAPYTFFWTPVPTNGQGNNGAFGLCAGDYDLLVTDAHGCTAQNTWTVVEPSPLDLVGGSIASECGVCNGETFVSVMGGTAPYGYLWTSGGNIYGTTDSLQALCAELYSVLVTDALGCQASLLVPVQDLNGEILTTTGDTTSCPGICDGTVEVAFSCGVPTCIIAWYDATGVDLNQAGNQVTALCAGTYIALVTNGTGCISIDTAIVASPDPIVANLSTTPETCFGSCDGTATVGPTGGIPPYTFVWDPAPAVGQGTAQAEGLCAGPGQLTITDAAGCALIVPYLILGPPLLTADIVTTPITCNGVCDGTIIVTPQGGIGPYTYNWTPEPPNGPGSNSATGLCAGDWMVQVMDANACDTTYTITLTDPPLLEALLSSTNNICFGECLGTVSAAITGGVGPYTIVWLDANNIQIAQDTTAVDSLCAGDYSVSILDASGCTLIVPISITQGTAIDAALVFTGETCFGPCDGTAGVTPTGGSGPYIFDWQPAPGSGQGTDQVTGLCAGDYTVTITDQLGCDTMYAFTIGPYIFIDDNATVTDVQCNGACDGTIVTAATGGVGALTYVWTPVPPNGQGSGSALSLCPAGYSLTITDAVGCDSVFTYAITEPTALALVIDQVTSASCADAADGAVQTTPSGGVPPYTFSWTGPNNFTSAQEDISGLLPGAYVATLIDAHNCVLSVPVNVNALITVVANAGADQEFCTGTTAVLDGSGSTGGTAFTWRDAQGAVIGNTASISVDLPTSGGFVFTLTVTDGPCSSTDQVTITALALPIADAGPDRSIFLSETTTLGGSPSGPAGSMFTWSPDSLLNNTTAANPVADPDVTTWFTLSVVSQNGCTDVDSVLVTVVPTIVIPSGFTPNGDGRNDTWVIDFIELFPECEVQVFNRWGDQLFRSVGYNQPWNGKYRDGFVPVGTYYYVIELNDERFPEPYAGPLTVIR